MTADDIAFAKCSYAEAKDKKKQIQILAELLNTKPEEILDLLGVTMPRVGAGATGNRYSEEFKRRCVAEFESGKPYKEITRERSLGSGTLRDWVKRYGD